MQGTEAVVRLSVSCDLPDETRLEFHHFVFTYSLCHSTKGLVNGWQLWLYRCVRQYIVPVVCRGHGSTGKGNCATACACVFRCAVSYHCFSLPPQILCMVNDGLKESQLKCKRAFSINTQKCLLGTVMAATGTRAIYFTLQYARIPDEWGDVILTLYYPVLLTGLSMLVSFWAEVRGMVKG